MNANYILNSALEGRELTAIESLFLMQQDNYLLPELFQVADEINRQRHGNVVSYLHGMEITYTNICKSKCRFCSFRRKKGQKGSFRFTHEQVLERIAAHKDVSAVALQGGLDPEVTLDYLYEMVRLVKENFPRIHLSAFSPVEVHFYAKRHRTHYREVLKKLKEAGLDSMPGTGAEVLNDKLRKKICPDKLRTQEWIDIVKTAHQHGITTNATLMFGHLENEIHVCEHLEILRMIQQETGGFTEFVPYVFVPESTDIARQRKRTRMATGNRVLKLIAISRMFFNRSLPNIQANWVTMGMELALRSLEVGGNDLGATIYEDAAVKNTHNGVGTVVPPRKIEKLIRKKGRIPMRRDALYNGVRVSSRSCRRKGSHTPAELFC
jgi:FO synthase subunit 2